MYEKAIEYSKCEYTVLSGSRSVVLFLYFFFFKFRTLLAARFDHCAYLPVKRVSSPTVSNGGISRLEKSVRGKIQQHVRGSVLSLVKFDAADIAKAVILYSTAEMLVFSSRALRFIGTTAIA